MKTKSPTVVMAFIVIMSAGVLADIGDTLWTKFYGLGNNEWPSSVQQTSDDGFIIAGYSTSYGYGDKDMYLVKTDAAGDTLWVRKYGGENDDVAMSVRQTDDGGYIMAGWTNSEGSGGTDFYVVKAEGSGELSWSYTFGGAYDDTAKCVQQTSDGGYVVCGTSERDGAYGLNFDVYVIKLDVNGGLMWSYYSGGVIDDAANSIVQTEDGNYMIAGSTAETDGTHNFYVERISTTGQYLWSRAYRSGADNQAYSIIKADESNFVIAGYTYDSPNYLECHLMKINSSGNIIWERNYGGSHHELGYSVAKTADGGYIIGGARWVSFMPDTTQFYLVKTDVEGHLAWQRTYGFGNYDEGADVVLTRDGHYAFVGYSNWPGYYSIDCCLMKIQGADIVDISEPEIYTPSASVLVGNFPNPFNSSTLIKYQLSRSSRAMLDVYDILGRRVCTVYDGFQQAGSYQITWNAGDLPSGIYFFRLQAGGNSQTQRMILLK